ncbi:MAG: aminotransferase class V-fold PLP-dependent enzyme, partial [Pseudomonadota bacterium]
MTGFDGQRVYLDWNATAPLRPEARTAMLQAMDTVGNPSSVHAEGRAARKIVERARAQVATLVGCQPDEVVFTSGATETTAWIAARLGGFLCPDSEHDCVVAHRDDGEGWEVDRNGRATLKPRAVDRSKVVALGVANGETGVLQGAGELHALRNEPGCRSTVILRDAVQAIGKANYSIDGEYAFASAHKLGGPKGCGALLMREPLHPDPLFEGGGQEQGRRSGTENVIGIAGFGAAAEAAKRDLEAAVWEPVEKLRNILEETLA